MVRESVQRSGPARTSKNASTFTGIEMHTNDDSEGSRPLVETKVENSLAHITEDIKDLNKMVERLDDDLHFVTNNYPRPESDEPMPKRDDTGDSPLLVALNAVDDSLKYQLAHIREILNRLDI